MHGRLAVRLAWIQNNGREVRTIHGVGEVLAFQAKPGMLVVNEATFTGQLAVEVIARIKLNARLGREHFEDSAAFRLVTSGGKYQRAWTWLIQNIVNIVTNRIAF